MTCVAKARVLVCIYVQKSTILHGPHLAKFTQRGDQPGCMTHVLCSGVPVTDFDHSTVTREAPADLLLVWHVHHPTYLGKKPLKKASDFHHVFMPRDSPHAVATPSPTIKCFIPATVAQDTSLLTRGKACVWPESMTRIIKTCIFCLLQIVSSRILSFARMCLMSM